MPNKGSKNDRPAGQHASRAQARKPASSVKLRTLATVKKKNGNRKIGNNLSLHEDLEEPLLPTRQIPWWFVPEHQRALKPGGIGGGGPKPLGPGQGPGQGPGHGPGQGPGHGPGHGPGPFPPGPGPGPFPPGPGPFPPGPGPFPPGPGPFPPGPGPFPPGPGPFPPGPGPFPPGPGTFPPGPFPIPFPIPIPIPIPGPTPLPGPGGFVAVAIDGGLTFPGISGTSYVSYYPGMTLRQALFASGSVQFGPDGSIIWVAGVTISFNIGLTIRYNGRVIPQAALDLPATPGSTISLSLYYL